MNRRGVFTSSSRRTRNWSVRSATLRRSGKEFRSAAALGMDALLLSPRCADPLYGRAIRVSMGAVFQVPWTRIDPWPEGLRALQGQGSWWRASPWARVRSNWTLWWPRTIRVWDSSWALNVAAASAVAFYATR
ncbi:hypothetical protein GCM10027061_08530 [Nesterenkonia suensis]